MSHGKRIYYIAGIIALISLIVSCAYVSNSADSQNFELAKRQIMLRDIGHHILLQAGDSTSTVLPVKLLSENEYQLRFQHKFSFRSDSLVAIIKRSLASQSDKNDYVVSVVNSSSPQVLFGYAVMKSEKKSIIPCSGRKQPVDDYRINILFKEKGLSAQQTGYLLGGLPLVAFIGLLLLKPGRKQQVKLKDTEPTSPETVISIGSIMFDTARRALCKGGVSVQLTAKESKVLLILASSPNEVIERARLQKEIWEDEGIIVGRSLDMFISKLRKKLQLDPSVKLVNIHGKGFRLETTQAL